MGCCMSVPPHKDEYIGHWMSVDAREKSQIIFHENGKIEFMDGDGSEYSGYIIRWWEEDRNTWAFTTNTFCCCFAAGRTFLVQKEPVEESGNWKHQTATKQFYAEQKWRMILDKIHYTRIK